MKTLGLLCNSSEKKDPRNELSPSVINRALLLDRILKPSGIEVFMYSPRDVMREDPAVLGEIQGYRIVDDDLVPAARPVPRVNANWTYRTRKLINKGMGYAGFKKWAEKYGVSVYVPFAFSEMVSDKYKAFSVVEEYRPGLHPYTENFIGSPRQVEAFLDRSELVFLKPRAGNRGNQIFVFRRSGAEIFLRYYDHGNQRVMGPLTIDAALGVVKVAAGDLNYIVQEGIQSLRYEGSVFDVRVVMVNDSKRWHSILETRLAPLGSDLSNVFQGGTIEVTEDLFHEILGKGSAGETEAEIRNVAHGLAEHLETHFPGDLMEIGFDMLIDADRKLRIVEINAKPGVSGIGSENRIFDWKAEDADRYERGVIPHVGYLAEFLMAKLEADGAGAGSS